MIYHLPLNIDYTFGRDNALHTYPLDVYLSIIFPIYRGDLIRNFGEMGGRGGKGCWKGLERQVECPEKAFLNTPRTDLPQGGFLPFSSPRPGFVLPKKWVLTAYKKYSKALLV